MFDGFLSFGGIELINAQRTRAYVHNLMPSFPLVSRSSDYDTINVALEQAAYRSPVLDEADWVEIDTLNRDEDGYSAIADKATYGFYGLYPLSIEGIGDSTMEASVTEGILDGGFVGSERDATRSIRVRGLLIGASKLSVEAGLTWLRNALRANACGIHGDMCGYSDLRYFLAPPDVCDPLYSSTPQEGEGVPIGALSPETTPWVSPGLEGDGIGRPYRANFQIPMVDGLVIEFGRLEVDGPGVLESYGPVVVRRANHIPNPQFTTDTFGWDATTGTITRLVGGGNSFGHADQASPVVYSDNWLPDPSFEHGDADDLGWRSNVDIQQVTDGTAPQGSKVAVMDANPDGVYLEASMLGPQDDGTTGILSFWTRHAESITVTVTDNAGSLVFTGDITGLVDAWQRVSLAGLPIAVGYVVRIATAGTSELRVDGFMLEVGAALNTYYDGDTADNPGANTYYDFVGGFGGSSRKRVGVYTDIVVETEQTNTPSQPVVGSFLMRSRGASPSVLVEILDPDDVVLATTLVSPNQSWTRFALGAGLGRKARMRFTSSDGEFDLDEVMLEPGSTARPYFDGSTPDLDSDYSTYWVGGVNASVSHIDWGGHNMDLANSGDLNLTQIHFAGDSTFRIYLTILENSISSAEAFDTQFGTTIIPGVTFGHAWATEIPMSIQLDNYDRTYHRVSCTVGVSRIKDWSVSVGAATEVDFVLTAANPHAFSTQYQYVGTGGSYHQMYVSDALVNEVKNPTQRTVSTGVVKLGTGTGPTLEPTASTYVTSTAVQGPGAFGEYQILNVGTDLLPNAKYVFSAEVYGSDVLTALSAGGAGTTTTVTSPTKAVGGTYGRLWVEFTTTGAGAVNLYVHNSSTTTNGTIVAMRDLIVTYGTSHPPFFYGGTADTAAYDYSWEGAANASPSRRAIHVSTVSPIIDPDMPVVPTAPLPPTIPDLAVTPQNEWVRYWLTIPEGMVSLWSKTIPTLTLLTKTQDVRQVRVRFFPNPYGWDYAHIDPTNYCGEFILSYLPPNAALTVDGVTQESWAQVNGGEIVPANHLLYGTGGTPIEWPELTCNLSYLMAVDISPTENFANLSFELTVHRQE